MPKDFPKGDHPYKEAIAASMHAREQRQRDFLDAYATGQYTIKGLVKQLGISMQTYFNWRREHPDFKEAMESIKREVFARSSPGYDYLPEHSAYREAHKNDAMSFQEFRMTYFGHSTPDLHMELVNIIEGATSLTTNLVLWPPMHGKSTLLVDYCCYRIAMDPNVRILWISKSKDEAQKKMNRVLRRLRDPNMSDAIKRFQARFGPFYVQNQEKEGKPWTMDYIQVYKATHDESEYTLECKGWKSQIYGGRYDLVICDDCQDRKNLTQTESMLEDFGQEIVSRPTDMGAIFVIGTRVGAGDWYKGLMDTNMVSDGCFTMRPVFKPDGTPQLPKDSTGFGYTKASLAKRRKLVGPKAWATAYEMAPSRAGAVTFPEAVMDSAKDTHRGYEPHDTRVPRYCGLDPALGGGNSLTVADLHDDEMEVLDCSITYGLARNEDIFDEVRKMAQIWHFTMLIIEKNALQRGIARDDRMVQLSKDFHFAIEEHETGMNKTDPIWGIGAMAGDYMRGKVRIPWRDPVSQEKFAEFIQQHIDWRPDIPPRLLRQDALMSEWFVWKKWQEWRVRQKDQNFAGWKTRSLVA